MYLIDTNVISEARKKTRANPGVTDFFRTAAGSGETIWLSTISIGELRQGVDLIYHRGDAVQAMLLEAWLNAMLKDFTDNILAFDTEAAQLWGRLRVPDPAHPIDKQIAAIALVNDLTLVTRNTADFKGSGIRLKNPFHSVP